MQKFSVEFPDYIYVRYLYTTFDTSLASENLEHKICIANACNLSVWFSVIFHKQTDNNVNTNICNTWQTISINKSQKDIWIYISGPSNQSLLSVSSNILIYWYIGCLGIFIIEVYWYSTRLKLFSGPSFRHS